MHSSLFQGYMGRMEGGVGQASLLDGFNTTLNRIARPIYLFWGRRIRKFGLEGKSKIPYSSHIGESFSSI